MLHCTWGGCPVAICPIDAYFYESPVAMALGLTQRSLVLPQYSARYFWGNKITT